MCKELEDELRTADAPALALVQHLDRMGASRLDLPVKTTRPDGKKDHWKVTVEYVEPDQQPPPGSHPVTAYLVESGDGVADCPGAGDGEPNCTAHFDATGRLVHIAVR